MEREYEYCRQMGFCDRDLILMNINSAEAAFLPPEEKAKLVARLRACLED